MNDGSGAFTLIEGDSSGLTSRFRTRALALADFNNDGTLDLILGGHAGCVQDNRQGIYNSFYLGIGNGSFTEVSNSPIRLESIPYSMAIGIADFNADGNMDVFFGNQEGCNSGSGKRNQIFFGDGAGSFTEVHGSANDGTACRSTLIKAGAAIRQSVKRLVSILLPLQQEISMAMVGTTSLLQMVPVVAISILVQVRVVGSP